VITLPAMIGAFCLHAEPASAAFGALFGEVLVIAVTDARLRRFCGRAERTILNGLAFVAIVRTLLGLWVLLADPAL
jgi:hypothetical protein